MDPSTFLLILGFAGLLALSALFSGSETALFSLDRVQVLRLESSPRRREKLVASVLARPERLLAGILLGNTVVNVAAPSLFLAILRRSEGLLWGLDPVSVSVVATTALVVVFGEVGPKGLAVHWPARLAPILVLVLDPILRVLSPAARALERAALALLRAAGVRPETGAAGLGRRELRLLFEEIREGKELSEDEGLIAANIFDFSDTRAYEIMTPRVDVVGIPVDLPREELEERLRTSRHSRLPVHGESMDQIIGYVSAKEYLLDPQRPLQSLLRPVHFVPARARLHRVLADVQARRQGLVVVVNEYGGTEGILTQEDLVEEVVGEIFDEQERDEAPELEPVSPGSWRVSGLVFLDHLAAVVGVELPRGPAETVAGHVAHLLGRPPRVGDRVEDAVASYEVLAVRRHRAQRVQIHVLGGAS